MLPGLQAGIVSQDLQLRVGEILDDGLHHPVTHQRLEDFGHGHLKFTRNVPDGGHAARVPASVLWVAPALTDDARSGSRKLGRASYNVAGSAEGEARLLMGRPGGNCRRSNLAVHVSSDGEGRIHRIPRSVPAPLSPVRASQSATVVERLRDCRLDSRWRCGRGETTAESARHPPLRQAPSISSPVSP